MISGTSPSRSREMEQQRKPFDDWESFPLALPRGSEAATFERPMPVTFGTSVENLTDAGGLTLLETGR